MANRVGMVSLGCAKNTVNSEQMLWLLNEAGYEITGDLSEIDYLIINTCGFIESAKTEAINNILEFGELKKEGRLKKIIVTGCLPERYKSEILKEMPEVDALVGCGSFSEIVDVLKAVERGETPERYGDINARVEETDRVITSGEGWAYIKIAEGCDNHCAYCVIPSIRGKFRSRPMENIVREAKELAEMGVKELIVVAQDITRYGTDLYGERRLSALIRELAKIEGFRWIRLHYLYPELIDDELISCIADEPKVVKYLDIPIQHINSAILKRMNRRGSGDDIRALFKKLRERIPGLVLRTSIITGLPGEGEAEFDELCAFLREAKIERAGVFPFSPEEGTPAAEMEYPDRETAEHRAQLLVDLQSEIIDEFNASRLGQTIEVLCEGFDSYGECWYGRSAADSPDVDGKIFFTGKGAVPGQFIAVHVTDVLDGDLTGEIAEIS
jgi:ribosomal protein S12 methylthiotransferase